MSISPSVVSVVETSRLAREQLIRKIFSVVFRFFEFSHGQGHSRIAACKGSENSAHQHRSVSFCWLNHPALSRASHANGIPTTNYELDLSIVADESSLLNLFRRRLTRSVVPIILPTFLAEYSINNTEIYFLSEMAASRRERARLFSLELKS